NLFEIFPNPSMGTFTIIYMLNYDSEIEFRLFDVTGKLIEILHSEDYMSRDLTNELVIISDLAVGFYNIQFITEQEILNQNLLIYK
ncbi:MAG: T9SS type A sorting domain-containing protein, partial [Bacteroidales bacterium]|nr:T9SS type A sorting domain-containing protein [Bacteroidales bacterium]